MIAFLILFLLALYFFFQERKGEVLFCLMAIGCNCFRFVDPVGLPIKPFDFIIFFTLISCVDGYSHNNRFFKLYYGSSIKMEHLKYESKIKYERDWIGAIIVGLVIYLLLNFLGTIIFKIDSLNNSIKVIRPFFTFLLYFYLRTFKPRDFYRFLHLILIASIIQGVFFFLQIVGLNVLSGRVDQAEGTGEITRYANYPSMASFFVMYYLFKNNESSLKKFFFVSFFGTMLVLGQMRGAIITIGLILMLYFLICGKNKNVSYIFVGLIIYQFVIDPMFEYRTRNSSMSTVEEIVNVITNPSNAYDSYMEQGQEGHFAFRVAMLSERMAFMFENPQYLPFGVGCIGEESGSNHFFFNLGTHNDMYEYGYAMLGSADIAWIGILMRFGLVGVFLFLSLFYAWARTSLSLITKSKDNLFVVTSLIAVSAFMSSFNGDNLGRVPAIMSLSFYLAVIYVFKNSKAYLSNSFSNR